MMRAIWAVGAVCVPLCVAQTAQSSQVRCDVAPPIAAENRTIDPIQNSAIDLSQCVPPDSGRSRAGVVPARILSHKPPKGARKEFDLASKAWDKNRQDEAIRHLREAIRLDPVYIEAQVKLGAVYADRGQTDQALALFNGALALEPGWALIHIDLAAALVALNRPTEAEIAARRALQLSPASVVASYLLGSAMLMQNKITPETADYLAVAAAKYPLAHKALKAVRERLAEEQRHIE